MFFHFFGRDGARDAVRAAMADREVEVAEVSRATRLDPGTIADFLNGSRWPRNASLAKLDAYFGWEPGTLANMAARSEPTDSDVRGQRQDPSSGVLLDLDDQVLAGLTPAEREEVVTAAKLSAIKAAREIRQSKG